MACSLLLLIDQVAQTNIFIVAPKAALHIYIISAYKELNSHIGLLVVLKAIGQRFFCYYSVNSTGLCPSVDCSDSENGPLT